VELTHARWNSDVQLLIKSLHQVLDSQGEIQQTATGSGMTETELGRHQIRNGFDPSRIPVPNPPIDERKWHRRKPVVMAVGVLVIAIMDS